MPERSPGGFSAETFRFLRELARNNNRAWFQENKARYEAVVQAPALRFIEEVGPRLARISRHVTWDARPFGGSLSRIYRDTRFSKDKSPYKTHVGIHFSHDGMEKDEHLPGFFFHLAPGESIVASGIWRPEPAAANRIRDAILRTPAKWAKVEAAGIHVEGETYARVPTGYPADSKYADALRHKDFFASRPLTDAAISAPRFPETFEKTCRELDPLNRLLAQATGIPW